MKWFQTLLLTLITIIFLPSNAHAFTKIGRLGLGYSGQLINNVPALSVKLQQSRTFALGGMFGIKTNADGNDYGVAVKTYRLLFEEPNLNFYMSNLLGVVKQQVGTNSYSGYQVGLNLGTEFHIPGIESIGFSFEFGLSINKLQTSTTIETTSANMMVAGVHFYL